MNKFDHYSVLSESLIQEIRSQDTTNFLCYCEVTVTSVRMNILVGQKCACSEPYKV